MNKVLSAIGASLFLLSSVAHAGIVSLYSDKATSLVDTGATSITGAIPATGNVGNTETLGDVTFSTTAFPTSTSIIFDHWSTLIPGNDIAISGSENLDIAINLGGNVSSFGFDFHEPSNTDQTIDGTNTPYFHDSLFTIEIFSGAALVDSTVYNPANDQLLFFGLVSDMGFDSVRITEDLNGQTYGNGIDISNDNEFFGEFYAGTGTAPEPSIIALFAAGLFGLGLARRRKNQ